MRKNFLRIIMLSPIIMWSASIINVQAEDFPQSRGTVSIEAGNGATEPLDPGEGSGETGHAGPLTIDNITILDFGSQKISSKKEVYVTNALNPNVQVSDKRGTGEGWTLTVASSGFEDPATNASLKGAILSIGKGSLLTTEDNSSTVPTTYPVSFDMSNEPMTIMDADTNQGLGSWVNQFYSESGNAVTLEVPRANEAGSYRATLDWVIASAP